MESYVIAKVRWLMRIIRNLSSAMMRFSAKTATSALAWMTRNERHGLYFSATDLAGEIPRVMRELLPGS